MNVIFTKNIFFFIKSESKLRAKPKISHINISYSNHSIELDLTEFYSTSDVIRHSLSPCIKWFREWTILLSVGEQMGRNIELKTFPDGSRKSREDCLIRASPLRRRDCLTCETNVHLAAAADFSANNDDRHILLFHFSLCSIMIRNILTTDDTYGVYCDFFNLLVLNLLNIFKRFLLQQF